MDHDDVERWRQPNIRRGRGHPPQHHQELHYSQHGAPPQCQPSSSQQQQSSMHKQQRPPPSDDWHVRSHSLDNRQHPPPPSTASTSMDPTGMFRNRGRRRVIAAGSAKRNNNNGVATTAISGRADASSSSQSPSPPNNYRRISNSSSNSHNRNHGFMPPMMNSQNNRPRQEHAATSSLQTLMNSQSKMSEELIQLESTAHKLQQTYSLRKSPKKRFTELQDGNDNLIAENREKILQEAYPLQQSRKGLTTKLQVENREMMDDSKNHVERITKQEEPDNDHLPQTFIGSNAGGLIMQNDVIKHNHQSKMSDDENYPVKPSDGSNSTVLNSSNDSVSSEHTRSTVGSTVSIMGSIVGEQGDPYDEARLLAVKRRMMQDVKEVLEEEGNEDDGDERNHDEDIDGEDVSKNWIAQQHDNEEITNTDLTQDSICDNNNNDDTLNTSLEVSFHNDTSFLDDTQPVNASFLEDHPSVNGVIPHGDDAKRKDEAIENEEYSYRKNAPNKVVKVADFSNPSSFVNDINSKNIAIDDNNNRSDIANNNDNESSPLQESPFRAAFRRSAQGVSKSLPPLSSAAAAIAAPSSELLKRKLLTPARKKFDRASASSAIDKATTTASLLVGQCFSFEDTTLDDDDFLSMPDRLNIGGEVGQQQQHSSGMSHKYGGLSAVASFDDHRDDSSTTVKTPKRQQHHPSPHRTRLLYKEYQQSIASPFQVIQHSQTWDHNHGARDLRQTHSFDPWSPPSVGRRRSLLRPPLDDAGNRWQVKPSRIDESRDGGMDGQVVNGDGAGEQDGEEKDLGNGDGAGEQDGKEKDWKKIEMERGDAINLLACMVEQSLYFDPMENNEGNSSNDEFLCDKCRAGKQWDNIELTSSRSPSPTCEDCLAKMKLIANSMKEISADSWSDNEQRFNGEVRSRAIENLLGSYQFALEAKRSSSSANKWLESIGWTKNNGVISSGSGGTDNDECNNQSPEVVALRARLRSAENTILCKNNESQRLNEELSKCRAEIGRLKSSSRIQSHHKPIMSVSTRKSMLSNSSSSGDSIENPDEIISSLVLCSPRPSAGAVKLSNCESHDESFAKWEKKIEMQMNLESRKEILLLKAALENANRKITALEHHGKKKEEPFLSEIEPIKASSEDGHSQEQLFMRIAEDIENEALDTTADSRGDNDVSQNEDVGSGTIPAIKLEDPALEKELEEYRTCLIASLRPPEEVNNGNDRARADSITSSDDPNLPQQNVSKSNSSEGAASDQKMINVRMIDGENFSTEWGLDNALPPPPDHGLHSPIVEAILSKWTDDANTRSALIRWMENILDGLNVDSTPSLKLSGLDHQIRDGFMMHVLPLLLRRRDVHVHLTSRAHRQTTYDIAVTVTPTSFGVQNNEYEKASDADGSEDPELLQQQQQRQPVSRESNNKHHLMAFQATRSGAASMKENGDAQIAESPNRHNKSLLTTPLLGRLIPDLVSSSSNAGSISTAVTSLVSNRTPSRAPQIHGRNRYSSSSSEMKRGNTAFTHNQYAMPNLMNGASPSLGDELSVGSSVDDDTDSKHSQRQSSIMGSISGALGLLSRRKPSPVGNETSNNNDGHSSMFYTPKREANHQSTSQKSSKEEEHSHHRVVSAPPGKIGITFVEYRGHAMVSNVSEESPLVGWVFPSDVLIAIDDVPVSGLRTRDIVKLLTNRAGQQRNLRMVSAVAMDELTRPGTV